MSIHFFLSPVLSFDFLAGLLFPLSAACGLAPKNEFQDVFNSPVVRKGSASL
jgi:hypothetical protein